MKRSRAVKRAARILRAGTRGMIGRVIGELHVGAPLHKAGRHIGGYIPEPARLTEIPTKQDSRQLYRRAVAAAIVWARYEHSVNRELYRRVVGGHLG